MITCEDGGRVRYEHLSHSANPRSYRTRLDRITASIAAEWVTRLRTPVTVEKNGKKTEKGLAPATIANYSRHVRCLFNEAVHQGVLVANPFARVRT